MKTMKTARPLLSLAIASAVLLGSAAASAADGKARPASVKASAPATKPRPAPGRVARIKKAKLPREWVWKKKVVTFDSMFRQK